MQRHFSVTVSGHSSPAKCDRPKRRQARLKIARQELPGKNTRTKEVPPGTAEMRAISRPCRDYRSAFGLPGSSCRATFIRPCRGWTVFTVTESRWRKDSQTLLKVFSVSLPAFMRWALEGSIVEVGGNSTPAKPKPGLLGTRAPALQSSRRSKKSRARVVSESGPAGHRTPHHLLRFNVI